MVWLAREPVTPVRAALVSYSLLRSVRGRFARLFWSWLAWAVTMSIGGRVLRLVGSFAQ